MPSAFWVLGQVVAFCNARRLVIDGLKKWPGSNPAGFGLQARTRIVPVRGYEFSGRPITVASPAKSVLLEALVTE